MPTMKPILIRILAPLAMVFLILAAACSSDDDGNGNGNGDTTPTEAPTDAPSNGLSEQPDSPQAVVDEVTAASGGTLAITMADNSFPMNNLSAPLNETTTIEVTNDGNAVHNMRIAGADGEWNTDDDWVSDPDFVSGSQTATIEFNPTTAGSYTFRCDFHPLEQGGVIVVQ